MKRSVKITIIGGGSYSWCPTIIRDILKIDGINRLASIRPSAIPSAQEVGAEPCETFPSLSI